ncbi:MAG: hydrogenase iron-sulfur subunit [Candidatus Desantisbacteria bacterium]
MKKIKIVIFCCQNCISDKDINSIERHEAADIHLIKLSCSGRLEVLHILEAFETGFDGVIVLTCLNGKCQSLIGNKRARNRIELAKKYLDEIGLGHGRLLMKEMGLDEDVQSTVDKMRKAIVSRQL